MSRYIEGIGKLSSFSVEYPNDVVKCVACYHHCNLEEGHRGICGIRHNYKGKLYSLVNTRPCSVHYDPIEKKPLYHFYPGSLIFSIGTVGCNMRCSFCQNWQTSQTPKGSHLEVEDVAKKLYCSKPLTPELAVKEAISKGCNSIAYTYNEPTIFSDLIYDTAKLAHEKGLKNVLVSNGYQSIEVINRLSPFIDAVNIDLKSFRNLFYSRLCGVRIHPILRNIKIWYELGVLIEVTTLLIPDENDSDEEVTRLAEFLKSIDDELIWHISAYRDAFRMHGKGRTSEETLINAWKIGKRIGLKYVYMGSGARDRKYGTTFCPKCNIELITRGQSVRRRVRKFTKDFCQKNGACKNCGHGIPGEWCISKKSKKPIIQRYSQRRTGQGRVRVIPQDLTKFRVRCLDAIDRDIEREEVEGESDDERIVILFATQTGVSEEYSKQLKKAGDEILSKSAEEKGKKRPRIVIKDMEFYEVEKELKNEKFVIVVTSTYFHGRIPRNGERFLNFIDKLCEKGEDVSKELENTYFAVMGIGSTGTKKEHLKTYQVIARHISRKIETLGGKMMIEYGEADKKKNFKKTLRTWKNKLWKNFSDSFL